MKNYETNKLQSNVMSIHVSCLFLDMIGFGIKKMKDVDTF